MLSMDRLMTLAAVILIPVMFLFSFFYYGSIAKKFKAQDEAEGALQAGVQENFTGVRVVRAFGREQFEMERFDIKNNDYASKANKVAKALSHYWGIGDMFCGLQLAVVMAFGIYRCINDGMTLGTFQTFYAYTSMMIWPVRNLGRTLANFSKASVSAKRVQEILIQEPEHIEISADIKNSFESIEFKDVTFKYNEYREILSGVSFKLKKGGTLGVLGGTGSGKSTISYLLTRLYDLESGNGCSGEILIDGVNIKNIGLADVRKNIALVLQEPFLYSKTIKQNITSPNPEAEARELHHAAAVANIHEAILDFPEQYDTIVGERGVTLSGGQKQRVAIARMLMQKSPVMIFDDSLSAVDTETDAKIRAALKQSTAEAAVIIISHRISTLMHSDYILVLHEGKVEDFGTHDELVNREGTYKRIYDLQAAVVEEYK
jgi:ATP-binding cassette subfamily B protein